MAIPLAPGTSETSPTSTPTVTSPIPSPLRIGGLGATIVFLALLIDAMVRPLAPFDRPSMKAVQAIDAPGIVAAADLANDLTDNTWAIIGWAAALTALVAARWWPAAVTMAMLPAGGVINAVIGHVIVTRTRPHWEELERTSGNFEEASFPSGHVMGAVMLYGLLVLFGRRLRWRPVRLAVQGASLAMIAVVGFARVWVGAHWPSDVIAAYALGAGMLCALIVLYHWLERLGDGLRLPAALERLVAVSPFRPAWLTVRAGRNGRVR